MARLRVLQETLAEVYHSPMAEWVDSLKRDVDPDSELGIWEAIANAYVSFCSTRELTIAQKNEVFALALTRSVLSEEETLRQVALEFLSAEDAKQLLRG